LAPEEKCGRNGMAQGTVKCFNDEKDYSFISPDDGSGNGFKSLEEGTRVSYEATQGRKEPQAENASTV